MVSPNLPFPFVELEHADLIRSIYILNFIPGVGYDTHMCDHRDFARHVVLRKVAKSTGTYQDIELVHILYLFDVMGDASCTRHGKLRTKIYLVPV